MKKIIQIEISYPNCDTINITQADLMAIQNEVMNQLSIVEDIAEGRFEIEAKTIEPINEEELGKLALNSVKNSLFSDPANINFTAYLCGFKEGYREAKQEYYDDVS